MAKKSPKVFVTVFIVLACVVGLIAAKQWKAAPGSETAQLPERAKGNLQAKVKVIEFIDFQCPACAAGVKILQDYQQKYPNDLYIELRYFPLVMHKHGMLSAAWAECASRQGKFWPFFDVLLSRQREWSIMTDATPSFTAIANETGVDSTKVAACLQDPSVKAVIQEDLNEGKMRSVASTPTYFINHEMVVGTKSLQMKLNELLYTQP